MTTDPHSTEAWREMAPEEVVLSWLGDELDSPRQGDLVRHFLRKRGADESLVRSPSLCDDAENQLRAEVLGDLRGWGAGKYIFAGLATDNLRWFEVSLTQSALRRVRFMRGGGMDEWHQLAGGSGCVGDAADRVLDHTAKWNSWTLERLPTFRSIADEVDAARQPPKRLILLSDALDSADRVVIEGCHRATGYCIATAPPSRFLVLIGVAPEVTAWGRW